MDQVDNNRWIKTFIWIIFSILFYISFFMIDSFIVSLSTLVFALIKFYNVIKFKIILIVITKSTISGVFLIGFILLSLLYFDSFKRLVYKTENIIRSFPFYLSIVFIIIIPVIFIINKSLSFLNTFIFAHVSHEAVGEFSYHNNIYLIVFSILKVLSISVLFLFFLIKLTGDFKNNQILEKK